MDEEKAEKKRPAVRVRADCVFRYIILMKEKEEKKETEFLTLFLFPSFLFIFLKEEITIFNIFGSFLLVTKI